MIIPAQIDESTIGDINKYVEDSYNALKESKPVLVALGCSFKGRINEKLQERTERAYEDIIALLIVVIMIRLWLVIRSFLILRWLQIYTSLKEAMNIPYSMVWSM